MKTKLWTIQHREAYVRLCENGIIYADEKHILYPEIFRPSYEWMAREMEKRLNTSPSPSRLPVWAWHTWEGERKRRDLRCSGYAKRGTPMVQIEFWAEEGSFLLSDFDYFHLVINGSYIAEDEEDREAFYRLPIKKREKKTEESWKKIFDLEKCKSFDPDFLQSIQATLWSISLSDVTRVFPFTAK